MPNHKRYFADGSPLEPRSYGAYEWEDGDGLDIRGELLLQKEIDDLRKKVQGNTASQVDVERLKGMEEAEQGE